MEIIETNLQFKEMETRKSTQRIILHHAAAQNCSAEDIHRWHLSNGWSGAGYHFLVRKDGKIYRLRPENKVGAHAYGANYNSLGICFEGDYMKEVMPQAQIKAGRELVEYLKNKYSISKIEEHKDENSTNCPGDNFPFKQITGEKEDTAENPPTENKLGKIAEIQKTLNERYNLQIDVDDIYGNKTKEALVIGLQTELNSQFNRGLIVDGIFGERTENAYILVKKGASGNITWLIQAMLVCNSYNIEVDGIFENNTEKAVKQFQEKSGILADGIVGKNTFKKLFE